jgi:hypothetical protein
MLTARPIQGHRLQPRWLLPAQQYVAIKGAWRQVTVLGFEPSEEVQGPVDIWEDAPQSAFPSPSRRLL